jgi:hypothetical protein
MAISEESRHHLYLRLEAVLGHEEATTLMEHLPPVGWADVATKHDVALLQRDLGGMEERLTSAFAAQLKGEVNRLLLWFFPFAATLVGAVIATR